tara:strand:+ start:361 stop:795 length:435 start_codon:yes stop_codon:yes gene_type:complete
MIFEDLKEMIKKDLVIDETSLDTESLNTPQLHNKYLNLLSNEKLILKKIDSDFFRLKKEKWLYFTGKMSHEQLEENGWEPFDLSILKTDIDKFINSDQDIIDLSNKLFLQQEKVNYIEGVVKIINNRQWYIRSAIDWLKFTNGV